LKCTTFDIINTAWYLILRLKFVICFSGGIYCHLK
jgi:hypothetical protein